MIGISNKYLSGGHLKECCNDNIISDPITDRSRRCMYLLRNNDSNSSTDSSQVSLFHYCQTFCFKYLFKMLQRCQLVNPNIFLLPTKHTCYPIRQTNTRAPPFLQHLMVFYGTQSQLKISVFYPKRF